MRGVMLTAIILVALLASGCANHLFYHPTPDVYQTPTDRDLEYGEVSFQSSDGTELTGWFIPAKDDKAKGTVIHFHGNAQNMTAHFSFVDWLPRHGYNLFVFDYRGYGESQGKPTRQGVQKDGIAAMDYIANRQDLQSLPVLVLGQSLGGNIALAASASHEVPRLKGILIDSTFASYRSIAADHLKHSVWTWPVIPFLPLLVSNTYSADDHIQKLPRVPILFVHCTGDQIVPYNHSVRLHGLADNPKQLWIIPGGRHLAAFGVFAPQLVPKAVEFFDDCTGGE